MTEILRKIFNLPPLSPNIWGLSLFDEYLLLNISPAATSEQCLELQREVNNYQGSTTVFKYAERRGDEGLCLF